MHDRSHPSPSHVAGSGILDGFSHRTGYADQAVSASKLKAYAGDQVHLARWCQMKGQSPCPRRSKGSVLAHDLHPVNLFERTFAKNSPSTSRS